jgi:hypothetical protein
MPIYPVFHSMAVFILPARPPIHKRYNSVAFRDIGRTGRAKIVNCGTILIDSAAADPS